MSRKKGKLVYSTEPARLKRCERCGSYPCRCPKPKSLPPEQQTAYLHKDRKGRKGKTVTVVRQLQLTPKDAAALCKRLKRACGAGGTVKDGEIEIQGDQREKVAAELERLGYQTKMAGG